jgi:uncharacterized protein (DUF1330 family)
MKMSAYVIVEASVRDEAARERCSSQVGPVLRKFDGEVLAVGTLAIAFWRTHIRERHGRSISG